MKTSAYARAVREFSRQWLLSALEANDWHVDSTATAIGINRTHLHRLMAQMDLKREPRDGAKEQHGNRDC